MDNNRTTGKTDPAAEKVVATIGELGEATAAAIAAASGVAYSTTNKKLRALEAAGLAEAFKGEDARSLWRLTRAGTTVEEAAHPAGSDATDVDECDETDAQPEPADEPQPQVEPDQLEHNEPSMSKADTDPAAPPQPGPTPDNDADTASAHGGPPTRPVDADQPPVAGNEATGADIGDGQHPVGDTAGAPPTGEDPAVGGEPAATGRRQPANPKLPRGALRGAVLKLLQDHPDTAYKVAEICKLLDQAGEGTGVNKASAGAVANALDKLVGEGSVACVNDKPATFQAA